MSDPTTTPASKPWQQSLTVQGAMVAGAAAAVGAIGPSLLTLAGMDAATAAEVTKDVAALLTALGAGMAAIGRMRLGGLH